MVKKSLRSIKKKKYPVQKLLPLLGIALSLLIVFISVYFLSQQVIYFSRANDSCLKERNALTQAEKKLNDQENTESYSYRRAEADITIKKKIFEACIKTKSTSRTDGIQPTIPQPSISPKYEFRSYEIVIDNQSDYELKVMHGTLVSNFSSKEVIDFWALPRGESGSYLIDCGYDEFLPGSIFYFTTQIAPIRNWTNRSEEPPINPGEIKNRKTSPVSVKNKLCNKLGDTIIVTNNDFNNNYQPVPNVPTQVPCDENKSITRACGVNGTQLCQQHWNGYGCQKINCSACRE